MCFLVPFDIIKACFHYWPTPTHHNPTNSNSIHFPPYKHTHHNFRHETSNPTDSFFKIFLRVISSNMLRAEETYRETKQGEGEDKGSISTALLSAGTALLMAACLKRAVVLFLVEQWQWRIWVFIVLNLILVAIFFTSSPAIYSESQTQEPSAKTKQAKIINRECKEPEIVEKVEIKKQEIDKEQEKVEEEEEEEEEGEEIGLSKEELNERVEAFIVMFKKQLISDARKRGNKVTPLSYNTQ